MSITFDKERKTYTVKISYIDHSGNRRQTTKRGFKLKRDAKEYEEEYLRKIKGAHDMSFASLVDIYLEDASHRLRETTLAGKRYLFETKITPFFGRYSILDIDAKLVRKWQNWLLTQTTRHNKPLSDTYVKTINNQLSAVMNFGVKFYGVKQNPLHITGSIGKKQAESMKFWTPDFYTFKMQKPLETPLYQ